MRKSIAGRADLLDLFNDNPGEFPLYRMDQPFRNCPDVCYNQDSTSRLGTRPPSTSRILVVVPVQQLHDLTVHPSGSGLC